MAAAACGHATLQAGTAASHFMQLWYVVSCHVTFWKASVPGLGIVATSLMISDCEPRSLLNRAELAKESPPKSGRSSLAAADALRNSEIKNLVGHKTTVLGDGFFYVKQGTGRRAPLYSAKSSLSTTQAQRRPAYMCQAVNCGCQGTS